MTSTCGKSSPF